LGAVVFGVALGAIWPFLSGWCSVRSTESSRD